MATTYKWQFASRFRRNAFGWQSQPAIARIKEALAEIKTVAKTDPALAADGAVLFLAKVAPALEQVDSSSGAMGAAVERAIATLVPLIASAKVEPAVRQAWLQRLWKALIDDTVNYIQTLGTYWGDLCVTPKIASGWIDALSPALEPVLKGDGDKGTAYFAGMTARLSALYSIGRDAEVMALIDRDTNRCKFWPLSIWGAKVLVRAGKVAEAIKYAEESSYAGGLSPEIACFCERALLDAGLVEQAYGRYAIKAAYSSTNQATFKTIVKKYPSKSGATILQDLVDSDPGEEGRWFVTAKDAGFFDFAIEMVQRSPAEPRTLVRATWDYGKDRPDFALACGFTAMRLMAQGHGYKITAVEVQEAYAALMDIEGVDKAQVHAYLSVLINTEPKRGKFIGKALGQIP